MKHKNANFPVREAIRPSQAFRGRHLRPATNSSDLQTPWYLTNREKFLITSTMGALLLLNISPINAAVGVALLGYICLFSLSNPLSALIALSASQVVANPIGVPLSLAQFLFLAWPLHILFNRETIDYRPLRVFASWTIPIAIVFKILNLIKWEVFQTYSSFDLAIAAGIMGAWYVGKLRGRWILGLACLGLGAIPSVITFWLYTLGVPTEGIVFAKGANIEAGVGVGRSDGNLAGVNIAIAVTILFAVTANIQAQRGIKTQPRWLMIAGTFIVGVSIPAVLATMSRGGMIYFIFGIGTVLLLMQKSLSTIVKLSLAAVLVAFLLTRTNGYEMAQRYANSMISYSESQMEDSILMSHEGVLNGAVAEILSSPLTGTTPSTRVAIPRYGYNYASHNVWLDFGRNAGFPAMIWFTFFFAFPIYRLTRAWGFRSAMPFLAAFVVFFTIFMALSLGNYKTFYILWVLTYAASCSDPTAHLTQR